MIERRHIPNKSAGIELRDNGDGSKTIVGYAAVYYTPGDPGTQFALRDNLMERIQPGAFDDVIKADDVRGLYNHDAANILGRVGAGTARLSGDSIGLRYEIDLPDTSVGRDLAISIGRQDITGSSFGFTVTKGQRYYKGDDGISVREITKFDRLHDVGPVTFPAYTGTSAAMRDDAVIDAELEKIDAEMRAAEQQSAASKREKIIRTRMVELGLND